MPDNRVAAAGSVSRRLSMCQALLYLRKAIDAAPLEKRDRAKVLGAVRIQVLRNGLLGRSGGPIDDVLNPALAVDALGKFMSDAADKPPEERARVATYVAEIASMLHRMLSTERGLGFDTGPADAINELRWSAVAQQSEVPEVSDAAVDGHITRGKFDDALREQAASASSAAGSLTVRSLRIEDVAPELAEEVAAVNMEAARLLEAYRSMTRESRDGLSQDEVHQLNEAQAKAYEAYWFYSNDTAGDLNARVNKALSVALEAAQKPIADVGRQAIDDVLSASGITQEEADAWAADVEITRAAANRLKKFGYAVESVRADMAEFYRMTRGRVSKVKIDSKGDRRANATDISSHGTSGTVFLGNAFTKRTLWHELAHHIEADPVARKSSGRLIKRRSVDGKAYKLSNLTGNPAYRHNEIAYKDGFFDHYVGKIYQNGITEVFSMGVESFSDPLLLGRRIAEDPQTLEFVAGYLKAEIDPLERTFLDLRNLFEEMTSEVGEKEADTLGALLETLAARIKIDPDTDKEWVKDEPFPSQYKGKQIGVFDGWKILEDRVRDYYLSGGRKVPGYMLFKRMREPDRHFPELMREFSLTHSIPSRDKGVLKAYLAVFQKTGTFPNPGQMNNVAFLQSHVDS